MSENEANKQSLTPKLRLVIRHLPPTLPENIFYESIKPYLSQEGDIVSQRYVPGKISKRLLSPPKPSRAYIRFNTIQNLIQFKNLFKNHTYVDQQGNEFKIQIIFSPIQLNSKPDKQDIKMNTLDTDPEFIKFCNNLHNEKDPSNQASDVKLTNTQLDTKDSNGTDTSKLTPLLVYLKNKKLQRLNRSKFQPTGVLKRESAIESASKTKSSQKSKSSKSTSKQASKKSKSTSEPSTSTKAPKSSKTKEERKKKSKSGDDKKSSANLPSDSKSQAKPSKEKISIAKRANSSTPQQQSASPQPTEKMTIAKRADKPVSQQPTPKLTTNDNSPQTAATPGSSKSKSKSKSRQNSKPKPTSNASSTPKPNPSENSSKPSPSKTTPLKLASKPVNSSSNTKAQDPKPLASEASAKSTPSKASQSSKLVSKTQNSNTNIQKPNTNTSQSSEGKEANSKPKKPRSRPNRGQRSANSAPTNDP